MAGASSAIDAPYPTGDNSTVTVRLGGYVPNGLTTVVVDTYELPWDCKVVSVHRSYTSSHVTADLDAITLKTVDATALTIVASLDASADIAGVKQTLHSDIIGTNLVKGNKIQITADSQDSDEKGWIFDTLELRPTRG